MSFFLKLQTTSSRSPFLLGQLRGPVRSTNLPRVHRRFITTSHFTFDELQLYSEHSMRKYKASGPIQVPQISFEPQALSPHIYNHDSSTWVVAGHGSQALERGRVLKVVSWNLECFGLDPEGRASAALTHLKHLFGEAPEDVVVMLQEIRPESLRAILEHAWVQQNFTLSNIDTPAPSFVMREKFLEGYRDFTLMMVPKTLIISKCFRMPFPTLMGRDALVVDIGISNSRDCFRFCTTHLESMRMSYPYRLSQLTLISALLKGKRVPNGSIGGMVGGDMNALKRKEHEYHKRPEVDLNDVWEDEPAPPLPVQKPLQKDTTFGWARGNTFGYQSRSRSYHRLDKFFYTGSVETVAVREAQDVAGRFGRVGIGLKTEIERWRYRSVTEETLAAEKNSSKASEFTRRIADNLYAISTRQEGWVSDHFGIVVGVRIP